MANLVIVIVDLVAFEVVLVRVLVTEVVLVEFL